MLANAVDDEVAIVPVGVRVLCSMIGREIDVLRVSAQLGVRCTIETLVEGERASLGRAEHDLVDKADHENMMLE